MIKPIALLAAILLLAGCSNSVSYKPETPSPLQGISPVTPSAPTPSEEPTPIKMLSEAEMQSDIYQKLKRKLEENNIDYRFEILALLIDEGALSEEEINTLYLDIESGGIDLITEAY